MQEPTLGDLCPRLVPMLSRGKLVGLLAEVLVHTRNRHGDTLRNREVRFHIPADLGRMRMERFAEVAVFAEWVLEQRGVLKTTEGQSDDVAVIHWMMVP
ncbi:MAG: hypothetical protein ACYDH5_16360 [Acidimicrobiales bacterium]